LRLFYHFTTFYCIKNQKYREFLKNFYGIIVAIYLIGERFKINNFKTKYINNMKTLFPIIFVFAFYLSLNAQSIYPVDSEQKADLKVYLVNQENKADLCVYDVSCNYQSDINNGKGFFVGNENKADKKVYFVSSERNADLKIYFVENENRAGWKNIAKNHLIK
jgi:hypothetical protein